MYVKIIMTYEYCAVLQQFCRLFAAEILQLDTTRRLMSNECHYLTVSAYTDCPRTASSEKKRVGIWIDVTI
jgi:hypothetical protein